LRGDEHTREKGGNDQHKRGRGRENLRERKPRTSARGKKKTVLNQQVNSKDTKKKTLDVHNNGKKSNAAFKKKGRKTAKKPIRKERN